MQTSHVSEKTIAAFEARRQFGKVLNSVATKGDKFVVEKNGEPIAAVVPVHIYEQWKRERKAFFDEMRGLAEHANVPEDKAETLAAEAVAAARAQPPEEA